ncbi:hypothetical protein APD11_00870 [Acinetobacter baumannii]|uniref:Uncharacterized protein n=1 Tax=Acinetobacter baumannii TaxID=470 RepID=A0AB73FA67_ACIBA|nr:hypothetical protein F962_01872 [Acinetobacter baumannii NIPH 190]KQD11403.1 hypothetical protein APD06_06595 [Acinetobacter baumannii]KQD33585.1 hypothetical protein APD11_00870 [Acinetobacter baumannii]KRJ22537.1 hypothetical protein APC81_09615 [Acinetobacter baumannii]
MPQQGQKMGEPADGIGQAHDTQILVRNMRDFVAEHAGQLAERETTHQPVSRPEGQHRACERRDLGGAGLRVEDHELARQGDQPDQDHRLDLDDAIAAQGHPHDGMLKLHGDEQRHDHAEHGLEDLVIERIERIDDQQAEDDRDQLQQRDHDDQGNDCGQRERDHLFEALVERHHCPLGTKCFDRVQLLFLHRHSSQF